jgi:BMFP domain-containing protein YqiC
MQMDSRIFDDFARVAGGALNAFGTLRSEFEAQLRQQLERLLGQMDLVPREEFEAVKEMAANARREQAELVRRVAALEARLAAGEGNSAS